MFGKRKLDHIVYAVPNLEEAIEAFEEASDIRPMIGGRHLAHGTKNALVNIGNQAYLEIIAVDETNKAINENRWMGVDLIKEPMITRWSLKSDDLAYDSQVLKRFHTEMGIINGGQRQTTTGNLLSWEMILPLSNPVVEIIPFMTDWASSKVHPTDSLPSKCQFLGFEFMDANPDKLMQTLHNLYLDIDIMKNSQTVIKAKIQTPKGIITI